MNKEDALRDLYSHERTVQAVFQMSFLFLAVGYVSVAVDAVMVATLAVFFAMVLMLIADATARNGIVRSVFQLVPGIMNGVSLQEKRDGLSKYRITSTSDLEGIDD